MKSIKPYQILLMTFFGMLGSIFIGFILFNSTIFIPTRTNFQFVMIGLIGGLFFSLLEYKNLRVQLYAIIIIILLHLIIFTGRNISIVYITRDISELGSIFLSVKLYYVFINRYKIKLYLRSVALALFFGLIYTFFIIILFLINAHAGFPSITFIYDIIRYGGLMGLGIGLGLDFYIQNEKYLLNLVKKLLNFKFS